MNESSVFGIICDETMDISRIEQFSMCVRYVTTDLRVKERFLGFWKAKKTDGESLLELLLSMLTYLELNVANIRAQCYDGAASMRGKYSGLATRVNNWNLVHYIYRANGFPLSRKTDGIYGIYSYETDFAV